MGSGMNTEQAKEYAKTMTYSEAVANVKYSKGIKYRKATMIKLRELAEIADRLDTADTPQTEKRIDRDGDVWEWRGDAWYCIGQADTPQTDCKEPIECEGCGEHICIGCEHQVRKEEWRKAQADCPWK